MKLELGLYKHMLTPHNYRFAKQAGASRIVAHLVDYFRGNVESGKDDQPPKISWATVYLASPAAAFVTGTVLPVDGGASIGF